MTIKTTVNSSFYFRIEDNKVFVGYEDAEVDYIGAEEEISLVEFDKFIEILKIALETP